jgi:hypothetical protein
VPVIGKIMVFNGLRHGGQQKRRGDGQQRKGDDPSRAFVHVH